VKLIANPVMVRIALLLVFVAAVFILGVWVIRRLRREMVAETSSPAPRADNAPAFAVATFQSVIRQLKDKEQELQRLRQAAQDRAYASENIAAAILTNLDTGVVLFNPAGLAQQANPAARALLGYATVSGMHARDLFRGVSALRSGDGKAAPAALAEALGRALRDAAVFRGLEAAYATPSGQRRNLSITIAPALGNGGECYGAVCLVLDRGTTPSG
jgi:PAS domain-containing protein